MSDIDPTGVARRHLCRAWGLLRAVRARSVTMDGFLIAELIDLDALFAAIPGVAPETPAITTGDDDALLDLAAKHLRAAAPILPLRVWAAFCSIRSKARP